MQIKKYRAKTIQEAMDMVRNELGSEAIILNTKKVRETEGPGALLNQHVFEILAAIDSHNLPVESSDNESLIGYTRTGRSFYSSPSEPDPEPVANVPSSNPVFIDGMQSLKQRLDSFFNELDVKINTIFSTSSSQSVMLPELERVQRELNELKRNVAASGNKQRSGDKKISVPPRVCSHLIEQQVDPEIVASIGRNLDAAMYSEDPLQSNALMSYMQRLIKRISKYSGGLEFSDGRPSVIALVGPTGVGKTTTIAKLAADVSLMGEKRVALFTLDTFRISAADQLRTYTDILHLPFEIITNREELNTKLEEYSDYDLILIDTIGRGAYDVENIRAMADIFSKTVYPVEHHLVLSATTKWSDLLHCVRNFKNFPLSHLLFTKLDETRQFGHIFSLAVKTQMPVSYMTFGQNVPEDIDIMDAARMTSLLLRGFEAIDRAEHTATHA